MRLEQSPRATMAGSRGRAQVRADDELPGPGALQAVEAGEHVRRLHAGGPDLQPGRDAAAVLQDESLRVRRRHRRAGPDLHVEIRQRAGGGAGDLVGEGRQQARPALDQRQAQAPRQVGRAVVGEEVDGVLELGGQLDTGRTAADDGDLQQTAAVEPGQEMAPQLLVEVLGLGQIVDRQAMLGHARRAEIVGAAADGEHQQVVGALHLREPLRGLDREPDVPGLPVDADEGAGLEAEAVAARLGEEVHLLPVGPGGAGREGVQHRLPDMREAAIGEGDVGSPAASEARGHLDPGDAAADDHDPWSLRHDVSASSPIGNAGHGLGVRRGPRRSRPSSAAPLARRVPRPGAGGDRIGARRGGRRP
ncbi:hypothetical protein SR39_03850 [Methylobacterium radiotolerans]|nr:hypothetical protein SR39_03850 [Methylobacterium radiotolerans]